MAHCRFLILLVLIFVTSNNAQTLCYRCFGNNWCNNFTDPDFINNVHLIDCPAASSKALFEYDGDNPAIARVLKNFEEASNRLQRDVAPAETTTWGCVTTTLHEAHEVHTIRTCLNNAATICPLVQNVILNPELNDIEPGVYMDCEGCTDFLCNSQTFETITTEAPPTTTTTTTEAPPVTTTTTTEAPPVTTTTSTTTTTTEAPPVTTTTSTTTTTTEAPPVTTTTSTTTTTTQAPSSSVDPPSSEESTSPNTEEPPTPDAANVALLSFVAVVLAIFANICVL